MIGIKYKKLTLFSFLLANVTWDFNCNSELEEFGEPIYLQKKNFTVNKVISPVP